MFRSFIYLDEDKFYTYKRQIDGNNSANPKAITQKRSTGFNAEYKGIGINNTIQTDISGEFERDISFDYDRFELSLGVLEGEDYFDCVLSTDYDLSSVPAMKLIRICNPFFIPENFDAVNLIDKFMPMLIGQIKTESSGEQEALESILGKASADIPILVDCGDVTISGKLSAKHLHEEYSTLEDYAEQEVYMLCKVVGMIRKDIVEIFDPLKDFIRLPRAMRRQMDREGKDLGLEKISAEGPILKVEIIAIYK